MYTARPLPALVHDLRRGFAARPRTVPSKWFYDEAGSALFDAICELPEYYLTRAERAILERHADDIVASAAPDELLEIGSGMARKTGVLLGAITRRTGHARYVPLDISAAALEGSARSIRAVVPGVAVDPLIGDFERDLPKLALSPLSRRRMWALLGSTIGNLDERAAPQLLASIAARMRPGDTFLVGMDLVKDVTVLQRAYDDAAGVTARFNKNMLAVINRGAQADFDLDAWTHRARYDAARARIEMHLESDRPQRVRLRALGATVAFERGERILTEISRKFTHETAASTLRDGGMRLVSWFPAADDGFALALAEAAR
ncbi:MAG: L-histidine N(alpha)-methyltransferase [Deltaproteobacteria bacterium]|nr:L-histidine N(alpha)-methyltransferase [Deltaproteobacteria bacterium]